MNCLFVNIPKNAGISIEAALLGDNRGYRRRKGRRRQLRSQVVRAKYRAPLYKDASDRNPGRHAYCAAPEEDWKGTPFDRDAAKEVGEDLAAHAMSRDPEVTDALVSASLRDSP